MYHMITYIGRHLITKFACNIQKNTQFVSLYADTEVCNLVKKQGKEMIICNIAKIVEAKVKIQSFVKKRAWAKIYNQSYKTLV